MPAIVADLFLIAEWICELDPNIKALATRIRTYGLPIAQANGNGRVVRARPMLAAVATASRALRELDRYVQPSDFRPDIDEFWQEVERCGIVATAVVSIGEKNVIRWLDEQERAGNILQAPIEVRNSVICWPQPDQAPDVKNGATRTSPQTVNRDGPA